MFQLQRTWTAMELLPLVCFCLLICSGTTFGDEVIKMRVKPGEDVILPCSLDSTNIRSQTFEWKKDNQSVFQYNAGSHYNNGRGGQDPQFKGRVFHFEDQLQSGNASIVIRNTKKTDSGNYSCIFPFHQTKIRSIIELLVVIKMRVKEDEDVILPCSYDSTDIRSETFDWKKDDQKNVFQFSSGSHSNNGRGGQDPQFKGRVFHFEDQLQSGNASIVIRKTKKTDSGSYSCIFPFKQPTIRSTIELLVDCILKDRTEEKIEGSCLKPSVTVLDHTKDWARLQCEVQVAFPKPEVEWLDSENKTVPAEDLHITENEDKYHVTVKVIVKKSGVYRCVSTQNEICHQIDQNINVTLHEFSYGLLVAVTTFIVVFVLIPPILLVMKIYIIVKKCKGLPTGLLEAAVMFGAILVFPVMIFIKDTCAIINCSTEIPSGLGIAAAIVSVVFGLCIVIAFVKICIKCKAQTPQSTYAKECYTGFLVAALASGDLLVVLLLAAFANKTCAIINCRTMFSFGWSVFFFFLSVVFILAVGGTFHYKKKCKKARAELEATRAELAKLQEAKTENLEGDQQSP